MYEHLHETKEKDGANTPDCSAGKLDAGDINQRRECVYQVGQNIGSSTRVS